MSNLRTNTLQTLDSSFTIAVSDIASSSDVNQKIQNTPAFVTNVAAIRALNKSRFSKVFTTGYYNAGDGGKGEYYLDTTDTTSVDDGFLVIVATDGGRWKLILGNTVDIRVAGVQPNGDIAPTLNKISNLLYTKGGGQINVTGSYGLSVPVQMHPNVYIKGGGSGRLTRLQANHNGTAFITFRPAGYIPLCIGARVSGFSIIGNVVNGVKVGIGFEMRDCMQCEVFENEVANFNIGMRWNSGHTTTVFVQAFFNKIRQNNFKPCFIGQFFGGAANRNTFELNSYADNQVAYDFSEANNWSETNTFINENVEGCRSWAEWSGSVYSQTWVGLTIENPSSNGYVCLVKDPGRQVFLNLSLIPLGNEAAITKYSLNAGVVSAIFGSAASSGGNRLGVSIPEELKLYNVMTHYTHNASQVYSGTIPAGTSVTINIPLATALLNDRVDAYALRSLNGCTLQAFASNGQVTVNIVNGLNSSVTISSVEISVILRRVA